MSVFFIAAGRNQQSFSARVLDSTGFLGLLDVGTPAARRKTSTLTLLEWTSRNGQSEPDSGIATDEATGVDYFLEGYFTSPQPVCGKSIIEDPSPLLSVARDIVPATAGHVRSLDGLNGSFALLSISSRDNAIHLYSDRHASRTIWRYHHDGTWLFASHPVLLWLAVGRRCATDPASLGSLLLRARPTGDRSLLDVGRRNLPGSLYALDPDGHEESTRWFRPNYSPRHGISLPEWGDRLASVLKGSAGRLKGVMKRPLLFLSGGLDSRLALAALASEFEPHCVTLFDGENLETKTARMVANAVGAAHHAVLRDKNWYLRMIERSSLLQGGNYHPAHSHFSEGLRKIGSEIPYDCVLLGDFLEAFQKLMGDHVDSLGHDPGPERLCDQVLTLDGQYAAPAGMGVLQYLQEPLRKRVLEAWRADLMAAATEALETCRELPVAVDYFLRWRAAYEVATYGMIDDVRSLAAERSLSMDNEVHDLMLSIPAGQRKYGRVSVEALRILAPRLAAIRNANTLLRADAPYWCHKTVGWIRPRLGAARQAFNRRRGVTNSVMAGSWTDCRLLATTDSQWIEFIDGVFADPAAFPDSIFDSGRVREVWRRYRGGELSLGFSTDSLLTSGIIHKYFGSGDLS